ncbi:MAG: polyprenyl diphosphate synthase [Rikenellaceae bacterium]
MRVPRSIAVIMDGNGRWAEARGLERVDGHVAGVEALRAVLRRAAERGVECITFYAFSTENWGRPTEEVQALMELMAKCFIAETPALLEQGVRIRVIGDKTRLSEALQQQIAQSEEATSECRQITMQLALNYSSRDEIRRAVTAIAQRVKQGEIEPTEISDTMISEALDTLPEYDPDLVIRTSGEQRLSNFMMWQASYSEFYFTETLWPDFGAEAFDRALEAYAGRDRRFGLVNESK